VEEEGVRGGGEEGGVGGGGKGFLVGWMKNKFEMGN